jgi:hypothetical protein
VISTVSNHQHTAERLDAFAAPSQSEATDSSVVLPLWLTHIDILYASRVCTRDSHAYKLATASSTFTASILRESNNTLRTSSLLFIDVLFKFLSLGQFGASPSSS